MTSNHPRRAIRAVCAIAVLALLGAGCTADEPETAPVIQPGAPGEESRQLTPEEIASLTPAPHTAADVQFVQQMIQHHEQALIMTALVPDRSGSDDIPLLAERMEISQRDEIQVMQRWLEARGEAAASGHGGHAMPGMLSPAELDTLRQSRGAKFDQLFLQLMTKHHQGALRMVADLYGVEGAAAEPQLAQLASDIEADQQIEISRMQDLLAEIKAGR